MATEQTWKYDPVDSEQDGRDSFTPESLVTANDA